MKRRAGRASVKVERKGSLAAKGLACARDVEMRSSLKVKGQLKAKDLLRVCEVERKSSLAMKGWGALSRLR